MKKPNINDALHPNRQRAIHIIEEVIEPILKVDVEGEQYYEIEDAIVKILNRKFNSRK